MHELSIASYLLESVTDHAQQVGAQRVLAIHLTLGERSGVVEDSLRFSFDLLAPGTLAEGAQIIARRTPMRFHCATCGEDYSPHTHYTHFSCPRCDAVGQVVDDGSKLLIESIEIETSSGEQTG
jgi:hydrogenase nickel incorporation protein HypA/HybF